MKNFPSSHLKRTPLFACHQSLKARMVDFGGWEMPVQYKGVLEEHRAVRSSAGLFDVSHMGEIEVRGNEALALLQTLTTNDVSRLVDFQAQYTVLATPEGGAVDDLLIYRHGADHYLLCVNASNTDKDFQWIVENNKTSAEVINISAETAQLAIQGPASEKILKRLTAATDLASLKYYHFRKGEVGGVEALIARSGYTGEDGFEIFFPEAEAPHLWGSLLEAGQGEGIQPIGLGARDTLRLEMGYPLYGHELDAAHGPVHAHLNWIVKPEKGDFIGREAILRERENQQGERLIGFEVTGRGIPRADYPIIRNGVKVGHVTSGTFSPSLNKGIGLAYAPRDMKPGEDFEMEVRGSRVSCQMTGLPFVKSRVKR